MILQMLFLFLSSLYELKLKLFKLFYFSVSQTQKFKKCASAMPKERGSA